MMRSMDEFAKQFSAIATPTLATVAGPIDRSFGEWSKGFETSQIGAASNLAGIPAITIPIGFGADHLPTGLQLIGRAFDDFENLSRAPTHSAARAEYVRLAAQA